MNKEFEVHMLNEDGIVKAKSIAELFDTNLNALAAMIPASREMSVVRTKLEEACFFAKKAMACDPSNQKDAQKAA